MLIKDWINRGRDHIFRANMKNLFPMLLLLMSASASADWVKINSALDTTSEKFIDAEAVRQTGPMNTMRRVWEISNLTTVASDKALSIKNYMEYDCKERRIRVLEESNFSEHWAQGESLTTTGQELKSGNWSGIRKGSVSETIFNRVCPSDASDTGVLSGLAPRKASRALRN